jgi:hypothetical protein
VTGADDIQGAIKAEDFFLINMGLKGVSIFA